MRLLLWLVVLFIALNKSSDKLKDENAENSPSLACRKNICSNCEKKFEKLQPCAGCLMADNFTPELVCSECQKENWKKHAVEIGKNAKECEKDESRMIQEHGKKIANDSTNLINDADAKYEKFECDDLFRKNEKFGCDDDLFRENDKKLTEETFNSSMENEKSRKELVEPICPGHLERENIEMCKAPLQKFVKTLQTGAIKNLGPARLANFIEFPKCGTIAFHLENGKGLAAGKKVTWKYQRFPIMVKYKKKEYVFEYVAVHKRATGETIIVFAYSNESDKIKFQFYEINTSGLPEFNIRGGVLEKNGVSTESLFDGSHDKMREMIFNGLWCDVEQLEEFARIEQFKHTLRLNRIGNEVGFHNELTFPVSGLLLKYSLIESEKKKIDTTFVWQHSKFPLIIWLEEKSYVFQSIKTMSAELHCWAYEEGTNAKGFQWNVREYNETEDYYDKIREYKKIVVCFPNNLQFPIDQKNFGKMAVQEKTYVRSSTGKRQSFDAVEAFQKAFWCDIKLLETAVKEFQDENQ